MARFVAAVGACPDHLGDRRTVAARPECGRCPVFDVAPPQIETVPECGGLDLQVKWECNVHLGSVELFCNSAACVPTGKTAHRDGAGLRYDLGFAGARSIYRPGEPRPAAPHISDRSHY